MMQVTTRCAGLAVALVATSASAEPLTKRGDAARRAALALGATTVEVDDGQTLTEADLLAGLFDGQAFALDADTTFNINFGGVIGTVGDASIDPGAPFDFGGATVNLNDGGRFRSTTSPSVAPRSVVSNLTLNYFAGGASGRGSSPRACRRPWGARFWEWARQQGMTAKGPPVASPSSMQASVSLPQACTPRTALLAGSRAFFRRPSS